MKGARFAALLAGFSVSLVVGVDLVRAIRPTLFLDTDPTWAVPRLFLWWALLVITAGAGGLAAALLFSGAGRPGAARPPSRSRCVAASLVGLTCAAVLAGVLARFVWLERIPWPMWVDDVSLVAPALSLEGSWRDFRDSIRPAPFGVKDPYGTVGVLYLEAQRLLLQWPARRSAGVRLPSALAGAASRSSPGLFSGAPCCPRAGARSSP